MGAKRDLALGHIGAFLFAPWPSHSRSQGWKFTSDQPYADPEKAARKLVEIANAPKGDRSDRQSNVTPIRKPRRHTMAHGNFKLSSGTTKLKCFGMLA